MNLEQMVFDFSQKVIQQGETREATQKGIAQALELHASLDDYYDEIQRAILEGNVKFDQSVTIKVDGKTIKFQDIEGVAQWITSL